jgi:phosphoserine aminotransferase
MYPKPTVKTERPFFSSGPCAKHLGWSPALLSSALVGRSHRAKVSLERIRLAVEKSRELLGIPDDYLVAITPGSATGAMEMALWNLIGARGVDILAWDVFGRLWVSDLQDRMDLPDIRVPEVGIGYLPDLQQVDFSRDVIFTWNGSTSGVCVPNGDWIPDDRQGLTYCDATSAAFAYHMPWDKLDVTAFSWQKALGGEAAHGMIVLGPRAIERLKTYKPTWAVPLMVRLKNKDEIIMPVFDGFTLNTPSMLCIEDYIIALNWGELQGGLSGLVQKSKSNLKVIEDWVKTRDWIQLSANDPTTQSHTTVCLQLTADWFTFSNASIQWGVIDKICGLLNEEGVAFDINNHRHAFPGLRIWCGPTVEASDLKRLLPWIDWAYHECCKDQA